MTYRERVELEKLLAAKKRELEDAIIKEQKIRNEAKPVEITSIVEQLELIEEKLGVRFDSIYGTQIKRGWESPIDFMIEVKFDVVGTEETLKRSIRPTLSAYNSAGQLLNTETTFIYNVDFIGIASIKIQLPCAEAPARLRLYPTPS
jgi:uncharacterized OsmC-like protein